MKTKKQQNQTMITTTTPLYDCVPPREQARADLLSVPTRLSKGDVAHFVAVCDRVMSQSGSFSVHDVLRESRSLELEAREVVELFGRYVAILKKFNKITEIESVYDFPVYVSVA